MVALCAALNGNGVVVSFYGGGQYLGTGWFATGSQPPVEVWLCGPQDQAWGIRVSRSRVNALYYLILLYFFVCHGRRYALQE